MQRQTSPGGSLFPYYYKNGELFCLHFGSYFSDEDGVIAMMKAEEEFFTKNIVLLVFGLICMRQNSPIGSWENSSKC